MARWGKESFMSLFHEQPNSYNSAVVDFILTPEDVEKIYKAPEGDRQQLENYVGKAIHLDFKPPVISATIPKSDTVRIMLNDMGLMPDKV